MHAPSEGRKERRDGGTGAQGQVVAVLRLLLVTGAALARWTAGRGGVSAEAEAGPGGRPALGIAGGRTLAPAGPAGPEPVHWTDRQTAC